MPRRLRRGIIFLMRSRIASNVSLIKKLVSVQGVDIGSKDGADLFQLAASQASTK